MASRNQRRPVPVPMLGIRADVGSLMTTPDMLVEGENIISIDGTLRPRPAHVWSPLNGDKGSSGFAVNPEPDFLPHALCYDASTGIFIAQGHENLDGSGALGWWASNNLMLTWTKLDVSVGYEDTPEFDTLLPIDDCGGDFAVVGLVLNHNVSGSATLSLGVYRQIFTTPLSLASEVALDFVGNFGFGTDAYHFERICWHNISHNTGGNYVYIKLCPTNEFVTVGYRTYRNPPILIELEDLNDPGIVWDQDTSRIVGSFGQYSDFYLLTSETMTGVGNYYWICVERATYRRGIPIRGAGEWNIEAYAMGTVGETDPEILIEYDSLDAVALPVKTAHIKQTWGGVEPYITLVTSSQVINFEFYNDVASILHEAGSGDEDYYHIHYGTTVSGDGWVVTGKSVILVLDDIGNEVLGPSPVAPAVGHEYIMHSGNLWGLHDTEGGRVYIYPSFISVVPATWDDPNINIYDTGKLCSIMQGNLTGEDKAIFIGSTKTIHKYDPATESWTNLGPPDTGPATTLFDGTIGFNHVEMRLFNSGAKTWLIAANGEAQPVKWEEDALAGTATVLGAGATEAPIAKCIAVANNRILIGNLIDEDSGPMAIAVSEPLDPDAGWDKGPYAVLGDTSGEIMCMKEISPLKTAIYKEDAIYNAVAQDVFMGVSAPFRFELSRAGIVGPASQQSVVRMNDGSHAYLGFDGGVYIYDGIAPVDAGNHIRHCVQRDLDTSRLERCWGMLDQYNKLLWFFYPTNSLFVNRGIVIQVDRQPPWPIWRVSLPTDWDTTCGGGIHFVSDKTLGEFWEHLGLLDRRLDSFFTTIPQMLIGTSSVSMYQQVWKDIVDYTDDGNPIVARWQNGWDSMDDPMVHSTVHEQQHYMKSPSNTMEFQYQLMAMQNEVGDIKYDIVETFAADSHMVKTEHRLTGRRFAGVWSVLVNRIFNFGGGGMFYRHRGVR